MIALYPIKPVYTDRIFSGEKTFELRRRLPKEKLSYILIYSTSPVSKVVGYARVKGIKTGSAHDLWSSHHQSFGISKEDYFSYFNGCKSANAIELTEVKSFIRPFSISDISKDLSVPQSFCYIEKSLFSKVRRRKCAETQ